MIERDKLHKIIVYCSYILLIIPYLIYWLLLHVMNQLSTLMYSNNLLVEPKLNICNNEYFELGECFSL